MSDRRTRLLTDLETARAECRELEAAYGEAARDLAKLEAEAQQTLAGTRLDQLKTQAAKTAKARTEAEAQNMLLAELGARRDALEAREDELAATLRQYELAAARVATTDAAAAALDSMKTLREAMVEYHVALRREPVGVVFPPFFEPEKMAGFIRLAEQALERERETTARIYQALERRG